MKRTNRNLIRLPDIMTGLVATISFGLLSLASASHADDSFYQPPSPLPAGLPGDIVSWREAKAGPPRARELAHAWQVMYLSSEGWETRMW